MLAEKVTDYQRKLDEIVQITNEENKLIKLQMNNQIINFKERLIKIINIFKKKLSYFKYIGMKKKWHNSIQNTEKSWNILKYF